MRPVLVLSRSHGCQKERADEAEKKREGLHVEAPMVGRDAERRARPIARLECERCGRRAMNGS
jgi:hypothetical protein